ncbi:hypothetical protein K5X82_13395 [Halosquirtibacter xylanolyticus]|uniref:hypothetical protein n=1 Tax=Halosquirtibacter xylanolyticus TaxID=3374599 RepID=UPI003747CF51|nr:hypothetical protein K5X82_13395 [Prolixibacteraceae bacterium]
MLARTRAISTFLQNNIERCIDLVVITTELFQPLYEITEHPQRIETRLIPSIKSSDEQLSIMFGNISGVNTLLLQFNAISHDDAIEIVKAINTFYKQNILFLDIQILSEAKSTYVTCINEISHPSPFPFRGLKNQSILDAFKSGNIPIKEAILTSNKELTSNNRSVISHTTTFINLITASLWTHEHCACFLLTIPCDRKRQVADLCKYMFYCYNQFKDNNSIIYN